MYIGLLLLPSQLQVKLESQDIHSTALVLKKRKRGLMCKRSITFTSILMPYVISEYSS